MFHSRGIYIVLLIIMLSVTSSCAFPAATAVPALTQTSTPLPPPTSTDTPTSEPTFIASPFPNDTPASTPGGPSLYLPIGIAALQSASGQVAYYDLQGQLLGELQAPGLGTGSFQQAHIAGPLTYPPGPLLPPLVFYAFENGGELWLNDNNNLSLIQAAPNLFSLQGVPGKPILAYSLVEYTDAGLRTKMYIGNPQSLPTANTVLDNTNSQSYAVKPLAISTENGQAVGIWYTTVPYGIGGDIVFEPRIALYHLNLSSYAISGYLDITRGPAGLSDDQSWVAYTSTGGNSPLSIMHNFETSSAITFPLREDSNRGSGDAVFSPDNHYVAWREAGGSLMDQPPTFHQTIRIATLDGNITTEIPDSSLVTISGFSEIGWVIPAGWLDPQTLVLEVMDISGSSANILIVKFDGSGLTFLAPGAFLGFVYP